MMNTVQRIFAGLLLLMPLMAVAYSADINSPGTIEFRDGRYLVVAERDFEIVGGTQLLTPEGIRIFAGDLVPGRAATVVSATPFDGVSPPTAQKVIVYETMSDAE